MMPLRPIGLGPAQTAAAPANAAPKGLREATQGVEAMFLRQMLAAARAGSLAGKDDIFGSSSQDTFAEMRDARFAEIAAASDAIGLSRMFAQQLAGRES